MNGLETLRRLRQIDAKVPVIMMTAYGTTQTAIEAMKLGAYDYLLKPFDVPKLKQIVAGALQGRPRDETGRLLPAPARIGGLRHRHRGPQRGDAECLQAHRQLAGSDATALITGESGTGKELVARAIYHHSQRSDKAFLAINCAAIPENLLESELFGHEKGAFTGATAQRIGKFEQCNGGTIFLDEIGDMTLPTQTKILRVLQAGTFERVGGNQPVQSRRAHDRRDQQAIGESGRRQGISRRFVLSAQCGADSNAAAARTARGHSAARELFSAQDCSAAKSAAEVHRPRGRRCLGTLSLARQRPRIGERDSPRPGRGQGRRYPGE